MTDLALAPTAYIPADFSVQPVPVEDHALKWGVYLIPVEFAEYVMIHRNHHNRRITQSVAEQYRHDIRDDNWVLNGEPIIFDEDGELVSGQHRLTGAIRAGKPFVSVIIWNVSKAAFTTVDLGLKRSAAQVLEIAGESYATLTAAAVALMYRWELREYMSINNRASAPTMHDRMDILKRHPDLRASVEFAAKLVRVQKWSGSSAVVVVLHYLASQSQGRHSADRFFLEVDRGEDDHQNAIKASNPSALLREKLVGFKSQAVRMRQHEALGWWWPAWNLWVEKGWIKGQAMAERTYTIKPLVWSREGGNPDLTVR